MTTRDPGIRNFGKVRRAGVKAMFSMFLCVSANVMKPLFSNDDIPTTSASTLTKRDELLDCVMSEKDTIVLWS